MNLFYLIGGLFFFLSVIARYAQWRGTGYSSGLKESNVSDLIKAELTKTYYQVTLIFIINGIVLVLISIFDTVIGIDFLAILILSITIGQYSVFLLLYLGNYRSLFKKAMPPFISYGIVVILNILGIIF